MRREIFFLFFYISWDPLLYFHKNTELLQKTYGNIFFTSSELS